MLDNDLFGIRDTGQIRDLIPLSKLPKIDHELIYLAIF